MSIESEATRKAFEEAVFTSYFLKAITHNPTKQFGLTVEPDCLSQAELCVREGEDYFDKHISAMWFGWKLALENLGEGSR